MRKRMVSPEWLTDERVVMCSADARVLSVALLMLADDEGRGRLGPTSKSMVFPGEPLSRFDEAFEELKGWYAVPYQADGQHYFTLPNWRKYQYIQKPTPSKLPPAPVGLPEDYGRAPVGLPPKGKERKGIEKNRKATPSSSSPNPTEELFAYWQKVMGHPRSKLDEKRAKRLRWAVKQYGLEDAKRAIDGCKRNPFNMGHNEHKKRYDQISLIFRDAEKVEQYLQWNHNPDSVPKGRKQDDWKADLTPDARRALRRLEQRKEKQDD